MLGLVKILIQVDGAGVGNELVVLALDAARHIKVMVGREVAWMYWECERLMSSLMVNQFLTSRNSRKQNSA